MEFAEYQLNESGITVLSPAFCITLFTNEVVSRNKIPEGLLSPYNKILRDFREEFTWVSYDFGQKRPRAITKEILEEPVRWLANPDSRSKDCSYINLYGGKSSHHIDFPFFYWDYTNYYQSNEYHSHYRLDLPLSWQNSLSAEDIDEYLYQLVENYPLICGYAGYTISGNQKMIITRNDLKEYIYQWHRRHPGLMNTHPLSESKAVAKDKMLFSIGWITLLGESLCLQLGGVNELRCKLNHISDVVVKNLPQNGALIRIGDTPQLGDVRNGDLLNKYHAVGRVLAPISIQDFDKLAENVVVEGFRDNKECANWLSRFFKEI